MAAASSTTIVPQILDGEHDYKDWSVRVKTYLLSKDLWDVVESEPLEQEGVGDFKFKAWRKNNAEALHAIQLSCGPRTFPSIRDKTTAKAAWDTLEALFNREKRKILNMQDRDDIQRRDYQAYFAAVRSGDWNKTKSFLDQHADVTGRKDSLGTALHNAVIFKQEKIVEGLVKLMTEEELEKQSSDGWTALAYAARDNLNMVKCIVTQNQNLIGIAEEGSQMTPILILAMHDRWDIVRYLFDLTPPLDLLPHEGPYGSQLLVFCLFAKQFDFAWMLLQCIPMLAYTAKEDTPLCLQLLVCPLHSEWNIVQILAIVDL
ncbi:uncharacterized protein [Malus domestica]|uniref:uncharacterized protein n=1 Tax=Malus domestica TaxID=3750 RepID=UPI003975BC8F